MGFKLGDIIHETRTAHPRADDAPAPPQGLRVAPESPLLPDGEDDERADIEPRPGRQ